MNKNLQNLEKESGNINNMKVVDSGVLNLQKNQVISPQTQASRQFSLKGIAAEISAATLSIAVQLTQTIELKNSYSIKNYS